MVIELFVESNQVLKCEIPCEKSDHVSYAALRVEKVELFVRERLAIVKDQSISSKEPDQDGQFDGVGRYRENRKSHQDELHVDFDEFKPTPEYSK